MKHEWHHDGYTVSTDPQRLDLKTIHGFLSKAYWSIGIPMEIRRWASATWSGTI